MRLSFQTGDGAGWRARLGLIVLQTDETLEYEFARMLALDGIALHVSRIPNASEVTADTLAAMAHDLPAATELLPKACEFSAIGYGCTSASTIIGEARVEALVQSVLGGVPVTNPLTAIKAMCRHLKVKRLAFVTPYIADVSAAMRDQLERADIQIAGFGSFEEGDDRTVARIDQASVLAAMEQTAALADCDAVFAACTNVQGLGILEEARIRIGKPAITSNTALAWHMANLAGIELAPAGSGL